MRRILLVVFIAVFLVGCQRYTTVDEYIEIVQEEVSADGEVEVDVSFEADNSAIIMQIMDPGYSENYTKYLAGDEAATEALEQSIDIFGQGTENLNDILPENEEGYQVWIRDYLGEDLLKYEDGELIYQKQ